MRLDAQNFIDTLWIIKGILLFRSNFYEVELPFIGALIHEGKYAESKLDFIHKYAIALKECNETIYWLELLYRTDTINDEEYTSIITDAQEIKKILSSSILTVKTSLKKSNHE